MNISMISLFAMALIIPINSRCQSVSDLTSITQGCLDLPELQVYYHVDSLEERKPLVVRLDSNITAPLNLIKFGEPVKFMSSEEIFFYNKTSVIIFHELIINTCQASATYSYTAEGVYVTAQFKKTGSEWIISSSTLVEK